jgi:hypothetical protein
MTMTTPLTLTDRSAESHPHYGRIAVDELHAEYLGHRHVVMIETVHDGREPVSVWLNHDDVRTLITWLETTIAAPPPPYVPPEEPPDGSVVRTSDLSKPRWRRDGDEWVLERAGCIELATNWERLCRRYGPVTIEHRGTLEP